MRGMLGLVLIVCGTAAHAGAPNADQDVDPRLAPVKTAVSSRLPDSVREALSSGYTIEFAKLDGAARPGFACELKAALGKQAGFEAGKRIAARLVPGTELKPRIQLHAGFSVLIENPDQIICGESVLNHVTRLVFHELAHAYDYNELNWTNWDRNERAKACQIAPPKSPKSVRDPKRCDYFRRKGYFSESAQFLALADFEQPDLSKNKKELESYDAYRFESAREAFAVFSERYFTEPTFSCSRPAISQYLATVYREDFHACPNLGGVVAVFDQLVPLNPDRIYQVHYFFAGRGDALMSRWGHSMLRLVTCPDNVPVGPECLKYPSHHLIVSFRANIDDLILNQLKGLFGSYASRLYVMPLLRVKEEYTSSELREITSVPLNLSREQIQLLTYKVLESFWTYQGKYYFLGNNCATETLHVLQSVMDDRQFLPLSHLVDPTSPLGIDKALRDSELANYAVVDDLKNRETAGYYFAPTTRTLQAAFNLIKAKLPDALSDFKTFKDYVTKTSASERAAMVERQSRNISQKDRRGVYLAFRALEIHARDLLQVELRDTALKLVRKKNSGFKEIAERYQDISNGSSEMLLPMLDFHTDGIPSQETVENVRKNVELSDSKKLFEIQKEVDAFLKVELSALTNEIELIARNIDYFLNKSLEK